MATQREGLVPRVSQGFSTLLMTGVFKMGEVWRFLKEFFAIYIDFLLLQNEPRPKPHLGLTTTIDPSMGLLFLIQRAVGVENVSYISPNIISGRFPSICQQPREVRLWVEPFLDGENVWEAATRIEKTRVLEGIGELAAYMHEHAEEFKKWAWVFAAASTSRLMHNGRILVPAASAHRLYRHFDLNDVELKGSPRYGMLVSEKK